MNLDRMKRDKSVTCGISAENKKKYLLKVCKNESTMWGYICYLTIKTENICKTLRLHMKLEHDTLYSEQIKSVLLNLT